MLLVLRVAMMFGVVLAHLLLLFIQAWQEEIRIDNAEVGQICHQYLLSETMLNWLFYPLFFISLLLWQAFCWIDGVRLKKHALKISSIYGGIILLWLIWFNILNYCLS